MRFLPSTITLKLSFLMVWFEIKPMKLSRLVSALSGTITLKLSFLLVWFEI